MKYTLYNILGSAMLGSFMVMGSSCTDYLDKEADSDVSPTAAFTNFANFQGFVEEMYNCIPDKESCFWCTTFNWGEDEIMNDGEGNSHFSHHMDLGDYRNWLTNDQTYMGSVSRSVDPTSVAGNNGDKFSHRTWGHSWYCIRKANLGIANLDLLTEATQDEKNAIAGELYFMRGWWHNELMQYLGGLPYQEKVADGGAKLNDPRISYRECALKAAADFQTAADRLPSNWDKIANAGHNQGRVTRTAALAYAGKVLLWAASPLTNGDKEALAPQPKNRDTYNYDKELAGQAAEVLGKALAEVMAGQTPYALAKFNYDDVLEHKEASSDEFNYHEIFYTVSRNWETPGGTETVFRGPDHEANGSNWNFAKLWGSKLNGFVEHDKIIHMPTANYINYAYGMANGRALDDPQSGFDPTQPFKDRDPRFYHDIIFDGERYTVTTIADTDPARDHQYAQFYTGHRLRAADLGTRTGYFCQKLDPKQCNKYDNYYGWSYNLQCYLPYMRLAEVYLLYAEALAASGKSTAGGCSLTAVGAINVLRNRVGCAEVAADQQSGNALMEVIRRERACELAFEGFRWNDLQRWCLLDKAPYNKKTSQEFSRAMASEFLTDKDGNTLEVENAWYRENDPREAKVIGWSEKTICDRELGEKHYWFPFPDSEVYIYAEFPQNPGW